MNYVAGGVGRALMFVGDQLWGIADTLSDNTFNFSITGDDIRGGRKNVLLAQYFHDSNLAINLTNVLFNFDDIALTLGATIEQGGLSWKEEKLSADASGKLIATETPVAFEGQVLGWYKKPSEKNWTVAAFADGAITVSGAPAGETYCIKYPYIDENGRSFEIRADYEPTEIHLVVMQDLFSAEIQSGDVVPGARAGIVVTDIPRFKLNGTEDLSFSAGSTASTSLSGNALAVSSGEDCEGSYIYGTMTESIDGASWKDNVVMIAPADADIELASGESQTIAMYAIFGNSAQRKDNSNFTFTVDSGNSVAISTSGVITTTGTGESRIKITLTGYTAVSPAYAVVTVAG